MLSRNLIPLVAETINSCPRKFGLAGPDEQFLIKSFQYHLAQKLKTAVEITFAVSDPLLKIITIGYMPLEFRETVVCKIASAEIMEMLNGKTKSKYRIETTIAGIPNNGLFLLYDFSQAYDIATNLKIADFTTIQFAYTACLHFASADRMDVDAEKWFNVLCEFSNKCISNGAWRSTLLCLDQAEYLLRHMFGKFDPETQSLDEVIAPMIQLGEAFQFADLPERSIHIAKRYMPQVEALVGDDEQNKEKLHQLEMTILNWQKSSNDIWADNAPLIVIGRDFAKKIS